MNDHANGGDDPLDDFDQQRLRFGDDTKRVYVAGAGPGVIVMTELPGITPHVARFARWVRDAGFTVWMPSLFGIDGAAPSMELAVEAMKSVCVRREFEAFAQGLPRPMVTWLRRLAAHAHERCGGPGVGAVGMCFSGNFALAMMLEPSVLAPVMSQPALPLDDPAGTFLYPEEMAAVKQRLDAEDLTVLAYRFRGDPHCRSARFDTFARELGDRFVARELPDAAAGSSGWLGVPHSLPTTSFIDEIA
jgi:dienelactone hydrolase